MFPQDPLHRPSGGGRVEGKDYTKFIRWNRRRIAIAALCLLVPYLFVVMLLHLYVNSTAAALMLLLLGFIVAIAALFYWLAKLSI